MLVMQGPKLSVIMAFVTNTFQNTFTQNKNLAPVKVSWHLQVKNPWTLTGRGVGTLNGKLC